MESVRRVLSIGSNCHAGGTCRHGRTLLLLLASYLAPVSLCAQPVPGSISTRPLALPASLIDAEGNVYTAGSGTERANQ